MKYWVVTEKSGNRHLVAAKSETNLKEILSDLDINDYYELNESSFDKEGYLMMEKGSL